MVTDIVKRLRMDSEPTDGDMETAADRIEALEAEVTRLRAALERIASYGNAAGCNPATFTEIASEALGEE
jgi:hypothetical protein